MMNMASLFESHLPNWAGVALISATMAVVLFFGVYHFFYGNYIIGVACFVLFIFACFLFISLINDAYINFFGSIFLIAAAFVLTLVSYIYGYRGLLYCFALPIAFYSILEFRFALIVGLVFCTLNVWAASYSMDAVMLSRFSVALALSFVFSTVISHTLFAQQRKHEKDANEDYLTGLMNQRSFYNWLSSYLKDTKNTGTKLTLYYFDIDNFKSVNDSFGHEGGDRALIEFSRRVTDYAIASNQNIGCFTELKFCRLSGDEFVLACTVASSRKTAENFANGLQEVLSEPYVLGERAISIRPSIGAHHFRVRNQDLAFVMRAADLAMYKAKSNSDYQFYFTEDSVA